MSARLRKAQLAFWALALALTLGATITAAVWYRAALAAAFDAAARIDAGAWIVALAAGAVYLSLDYVRFAALFRTVGVKLPVALAPRLVSVSYFVSSLTPWMELHLPAMVHLLVRAGIPERDARAVTIAKSLYTDLWIATVTFVAVLLQDPRDVPWPFGDHLGLTAVLIGGLVAALGAIALGAPIPIARAAPIAAAIAVVGRGPRSGRVLAHAAALALVLVHALIGHTLARGIGIAITPARSLGVFSGSLLFVYLSPVPGSIGIGEVFTAYLLDPALGPESLAVGILVRAICWHAVIPAGAVFLAGSLPGVRVRDLVRAFGSPQ